MVLSRSDIKDLLAKWNQAWDRHDLKGVVQLFHEDVLFDNWNGAKARGRDSLQKAWTAWFENHGDFRFTSEDTFIDETEQKVLYRWQLDWPSKESGFEGQHESRRGVDVLHFKDGKIIEKLTYCKTSVEISGHRIALSANS
jgi:ketosteroid isomerase-like protein